MPLWPLWRVARKLSWLSSTVRWGEYKTCEDDDDDDIIIIVIIIVITTVPLARVTVAEPLFNLVMVSWT